jgi:hypothetical protein
MNLQTFLSSIETSTGLDRKFDVNEFDKILLGLEFNQDDLKSDSLEVKSKAVCTMLKQMIGHHILTDIGKILAANNETVNIKMISSMELAIPKIQPLYDTLEDFI